MMTEGEQSRFVRKGVCGVTANPATMARAINPGPDYHADIQHAAAARRSASEIVERLDRLDIGLADIAARLKREGVQRFAEAFDKSINAIRTNARS